MAGREVLARVYDLRVVVDEIRGFCDLPMKVGDYFEVSGGRITIPAGKFMCIWALQSILLMLPAKQRAIAEDNDWLERADRVACPDPDGMVIFRIERVSRSESGAASMAPAPRLLVDERVCAGCRACELVCSFVHERRFSAELSRICVEKVEEDGIDRPVVCRQCGNARCVDACQAGALARDPVTRCVKVHDEACVRCGACARACPFGAISFHPERATPLICDLCGGDPECVKRCATGAISFGRAGEARWAAAASRGAGARAPGTGEHEVFALPGGRPRGRDRDRG